MPIRLAITMPLHNGSRTVRKAVLSIFEQRNTSMDTMLLIADDSSTDDWYKHIEDLMDIYPIFVEKVNYKNVVKTRNHLLKRIYENRREIDYIARLDCDDVLANEDVFFHLENYLDNNDPDVLLMGNKLSSNGQLLERENRGIPELLDNDYVVNRLFRMAQGDATAELPSCNVLFKRDVGCLYPDEKSGEDHWLLVELLLKKTHLDVQTLDLLYATYSLTGSVTGSNKDQGIYLDSRQRLFERFIERHKNAK